MNAIAQAAVTSVTRDGILTLASFASPEHDAISFYFSRAGAPNEAHREEGLLIREMAERLLEEAQEKPFSAFRSDVESVLATREKIRLSPGSFWAIFACRNRQLWREFQLPVCVPQQSLSRGRHLRIAPLLHACNALEPFGVVLLESGKARAFVIRGTDIQEIMNGLPSVDLKLRAQDSRVGWSSHIDANQAEAERAYFRSLRPEIENFLSRNHIANLAIGCRQDLWGEMASPQLATLEKSYALRRFQFPNFDIAMSEVLTLAFPLLRQMREERIKTALAQVHENPARTAQGVSDVLGALADGRVRTLLLGNLDRQYVAECASCGSLAESGAKKCPVCGSTQMNREPADECLLRRAFATDAETLLVPKDSVSGFAGAAAWLRY